MSGRDTLTKDASIYNEDYFKRYLLMADTTIGKAIHATRWRLVERYCSEKGMTLLDYGSGPGTFNASGPNSFRKFNYDINPMCGFREIPKEPIDIMCMWDSLEHIPDFYGAIKSINPKWLFVATPNLASVDGPVEFWKHYRPKEHLYYFDKYSLEVIMGDLGYSVVEMNYDEGKIRDPKNPAAILTAVFKKHESHN